jgi:phosphoglycolate phosphatase
MTFKAVIFDLDGTLLNSLKGLALAMNMLLRRLGYPTHPVNRFKKFVGSGITGTVRRALPESIGPNFPIDRFVSDYRRLYDTLWLENSPPYDGIADLLDHLAKEKIKTAVLSNKSDDFTKRMAAALLPGHDFERVLGDRPGVPLKPDPAAAVEIAESTGINPGEFIFLGDSGIDMETAARAGMYGVGALWGFREAGELVAQGAKKLIRHPSELLEIFRKNVHGA